MIPTSIICAVVFIDLTGLSFYMGVQTMRRERLDSWKDVFGLDLSPMGIEQANMHSD